MENRVSDMKWGWKFCADYRYELLGYFLLEVASLVFGLLSIWWSKEAIDISVRPGNQGLLPIISMLSTSLLMSYLSSVFATRLNERTKARMLMDLQGMITRAQFNSKVDGSIEIESGDLIVRAGSNAQETVQLLGNNWISVILMSIRIFAAVVFLGHLDSQLAAVLVFLLPLVLLSRPYFRKLKGLNISLKELEGKLGNLIQENFRSRTFIRQLNREEERWEMLQDSNSNIFWQKMDLINFTVRSRGIFGAALHIGYLFTFSWGLFRIQQGEISFGTMTAFLQLVGRVQGPFVSMIALLPAIVRSKTAMERVVDALLVPQEDRKGASHQSSSIKGLELSSVVYGYGGEPVLKGHSFLFKEGEPTAVIGASGKGKSTLLRLLMGLHLPNSGHVLVHTEGRAIPMSADLRKNIAFVPQGDKLLSGTVLYNLVGSRQQVPEAMIGEALRISCSEFIHDLPMGLDTQVGEGGYALSEGQAQRIGVARAILQGAKVWLLDEVTSALDEQNRENLVNNLLEAGSEKVVIFVTHDISLANKCTHKFNI